MKREVFVIIGRGGSVLFSDASSSPAALPDSRARWEAIWRHRTEIELLVHSHPIGPHAFSAEDESTMKAVEDALGRELVWAVVSPEGVLTREKKVESTVPAPWWAELVRLASGM